MSFDVLNNPGVECEVVQSLAKWKRYALSYYGFKVDEGLYTDMNAIRRDDKLDRLHSIYVDQWDWERVISKEERNIDFLKGIVTKIVGAVADTANIVNMHFPLNMTKINREVKFVTTQELEDLYPDGMDETELNDLLWFEPETVYEWLGIEGEEEEEAR